MEKGNKGKVLAAVAGAVVGAGAVIASVIAMKDKGNQKKVKDLISTAKEAIQEYKAEVKDKTDKSKENIKNMASDAIKTAEKVTKSAKKEIKKL